MKIGIVDVDWNKRSNFPNFALMKISNYYKKNGDVVEWASLGYYDIIYISKVFTFSKEVDLVMAKSENIIKGGTGYKSYDELPSEIDACLPDYSIYPNLKHAYGFLTRGCINKCSWCVVPRKEGAIRAYRDIEDIVENKKSAILMDNNILAIDYGLNQIEKIVKMGVRVDFNQGLDARIIAGNEDIAKLLTKVKWLKYLRMACDTKEQIYFVKKAVELLIKHGMQPHNIFIYTLIKDVSEGYERVMAIKNMGCKPFAQPFLDFEKDIMPTKLQRDFARWVNHKAIFYSVDFNDYKKNIKKL